MIGRFALIIGAMKAGTSSLFHQMSEHPRIAAASDKEPEFFTDDEALAEGKSRYESLWRAPSETFDVALEGSTSYTKRPSYQSAAERIAEYGASFEFIYLLRDPIDRIESHLTHMLINGQLDRRRPVRELPHPIDTSRYAAQLRAYTRRFSRGDIHLASFERFVSDPEDVLDEIFAFLGLETGVPVENLGQNFNPTADYRDGWLSNRIQELTDSSPETIAELPDPYRGLYRALFQERVPRQELTDRELDFVRFNLESDVRRLENRFGFDTSRWHRFWGTENRD